MRAIKAIIAFVVFVGIFSGLALSDSREIYFRKDAFARMRIAPADTAEGAQSLKFFKKKPNSQLQEVANAYTLNYTLRHIGGIIFMAEARPAAGVEWVCPAVSLDPNKPNGSRLVVAAGSTKTYHSDIYDWEIIPVVKFVQSGHDALFSYMGYQAQYDDAYNNTLAGVILFLLDNSRDIVDFPSAHLILENPAPPGFTQTAPSPESLFVWPKLREALGSSQLLFMDSGVDFAFRGAGENFVISGKPYWARVARTSEDDNEPGLLLEAFDGPAADEFAVSNPVIYGSIFRIAKHTAFFRYLKKECAKEWRRFMSNFDIKRTTLDNIVVPNSMMPSKIN